jgi:hypothetical protein
MTEIKPPITKGKVVINLKGVAIIFFILFLISMFFTYHLIKFNKKIEIFNNKVTVGMKESEVIELLGRPTYKWFHKSHERLTKLTGIRGEIYELIYSGLFVLKDDIRLYFDSKTNKLIFKERCGHTVIRKWPGHLYRFDTGSCDSFDL